MHLAEPIAVARPDHHAARYRPGHVVQRSSTLRRVIGWDFRRRSSSAGGMVTTLCPSDLGWKGLAFGSPQAGQAIRDPHGTDLFATLFTAAASSLLARGTGRSSGARGRQPIWLRDRGICCGHQLANRPSSAQQDRRGTRAGSGHIRRCALHRETTVMIENPHRQCDYGTSIPRVGSRAGLMRVLRYGGRRRSASLLTLRTTSIALRILVSRPKTAGRWGRFDNQPVSSGEYSSFESWSYFHADRVHHNRAAPMPHGDRWSNLLDCLDQELGRVGVDLVPAPGNLSVSRPNRHHEPVRRTMLTSMIESSALGSSKPSAAPSARSPNR